MQILTEVSQSTVKLSGATGGSLTASTTAMLYNYAISKENKKRKGDVVYALLTT